MKIRTIKPDAQASHPEVPIYRSKVAREGLMAIYE